jgi:type II secretory pathway pseudopilin PulG
VSGITEEQFEDVRRQLPVVSAQLDEVAKRTVQAQRLIRMVIVLTVIAVLSLATAGWTITQTRDVQHDTQQVTNQINDCLIGTCAKLREQRDALLDQRSGIESEIRRLNNEITIAQARDDQLAVSERTKLRDQELKNRDDVNARIAAIATQIPRQAH